ncbi:hypothetical protein KGP36_03330 [Patescibacteria group bacterium]|nr:hypothetical protein [Patescibacteria group bacterium]
MPVIPSSAYVTLETVTTLIRAIANDMLFSSAGEILTDSAAFMLPLLNDALEWFTEECNNHGVGTFVKETVLTPLTATPDVSDPATQVSVSDTGYNDGAGMHLAPQLPTDLLVPLFLWERQTAELEDWVEMTERPDGLPSVLPGLRFRIWEWRTDALYMPGATQSNDVRLRYTSTLPQFSSVNDTLYFRGATGCLAYYMVSSYLSSKNPDAAKMAESRAAERLNQIVTRSSRMKQREAISRRSYGNPRGGPSFVPPRNP